MDTKVAKVMFRVVFGSQEWLFVVPLALADLSAVYSQHAAKGCQVQPSEC